MPRHVLLTGAWLLGLGACSPNAAGLGSGGSSEGSGSGASSDGGETTDASAGPAADASGGSAAGSSGGTKPDEATTTGGGGSTGEPDASGESTGEVRPSLCDPAEGLRACYDFANVGGGTVVDGSGNGNDGHTTNVVQVPGPFGDAAQIGPGSRIEVQDSSSLDITGSLTVEVWTRVEALPSANRMGLLDNDGQYSVFFYSNGEYRCSAGEQLLFGGSVPKGEWIHVACVYDHEANTMALYVDGALEAMTPTNGDPIPTNNPQPVALGSDSPSFNDRLDGVLGGVRVWSTARSPEQLCEAAGDLCP